MSNFSSPVAGAFAESADLFRLSTMEHSSSSTDPYGDGPLDTDKMGTIRVDHGDVIIYLSEDDNDQLLLDSETFKQFETLAVSMSGRWKASNALSRTVPDAKEGRSCDIWQYGLKWIEDKSDDGIDTGHYELQPGVSLRWAGSE